MRSDSDSLQEYEKVYLIHHHEEGKAVIHTGDRTFCFFRVSNILRSNIPGRLFIAQKLSASVKILFDSVRTVAITFGSNKEKVQPTPLQAVLLDVNKDGKLTNADKTRLRAVQLKKTQLGW